MGILDDAIREHLDLKRRLGAEDGELARLEDEAFGPPTRPGDPDFPEQDAEAPADAEAVTGEAQAEAPPAAEAPSEVLAAEVSESAPAPDPPDAPDAPDAADAGEGDASGFYDHEGDELHLDLDHEPPAEPEAPAEAEPSQQAEATEAEAEAEVAPETADEPAVEPSPPAAEPPIESLDTVEHSFEGAIEDTGEAEVVEGELADEPDADAEDEDVLEETPEFLRDAPEDDELWFEQGEPKDFDF